MQNTVYMLSQNNKNWHEIYLKLGQGILGIWIIFNLLII